MNNDKAEGKRIVSPIIAPILKGKNGEHTGIETEGSLRRPLQKSKKDLDFMVHWTGWCWWMSGEKSLDSKYTLKVD